MPRGVHDLPEYMGPTYFSEKSAVDTLWAQLETLQGIAANYGIMNIFQDNGAEILQQLIYMNFAVVPGREGNDGVDRNGCQWEMKSLDISKGNKGITTNHHLTQGIIDKYRTVPWSISIYDRIRLKNIYIIGREKLEPLYLKWEEQLQTREHINNPKIPLKFIEENGYLIFKEGDQIPLNPLSIIDTRPYVELQRQYFEAHG